MKKIHRSIRLDPEVASLHDTISSIGGMNKGQVIEALTYMLVEKHSIKGILDYATTLDFKDGRRKNNGTGP